MDPARIAELLRPFLACDGAARLSLTSQQLEQISTYIDLLLRWNARMNLTAVRQPEEIVTRHFGESLFAAQHLFPSRDVEGRFIDIGSGAGFPGLPIKIWNAKLHTTLIESNHKKATFLREVIRTLTLTNIDVFAGRAEDFPGSADLVILRAVERFEAILPTAAGLVVSGGRLAVLIGEGQVKAAHEKLPELRWLALAPIPQSTNRVLLVGERAL